ncbi:AraC-type DNA-binding protein [Clostridium cavendishii DSM 21758]|uniref:AraC-type DNA-binding protein n=1 Tax=Clostridium cavendishii DSM 21758 TaxID=1121302 RepID=A0A1M6VBF3_9CLOT|nr:AraC family transcriptional regulator [Clostridium cavendishii]SHK78694.1 AraC-type DNA-binding protein [Clostridium cavendishii DSM 21758]
MINSKQNQQFLVEDLIREKLRSGQIDKVLEIYEKSYRVCLFNDLIEVDARDALKRNIIILMVATSRGLLDEEKTCNSLRITCSLYLEKLNKVEKFINIYELGKEYLIEIDKILRKNNYSCKNFVVRKVMTYIKENLQEDLSLDLLSKQVHLSKNYLSTLFVEATGEKITSYINNQRLKKSKELLKEGDYSLAYVSDLCGFKNQSYFSMVFKERERISPSIYRKLNKR